MLQAFGPVNCAYAKVQNNDGDEIAGPVSYKCSNTKPCKHMLHRPVN